MWITVWGASPDPNFVEQRLHPFRLELVETRLAEVGDYVSTDVHADCLQRFGSHRALDRAKPTLHEVP